MPLLKFVRKVLSRVRRGNGGPNERNSRATALTAAPHHHTSTPPIFRVDFDEPPAACSDDKASNASPTPPSSTHSVPEDCAICQDPVGLPNPEGVVEKWATLHCGHKFGSNCIHTWLQESVDSDDGCNPTCPICRTIARHPCGHIISPPVSSVFNEFYGMEIAWESIMPTAQPPRRRRGRRFSRRRESAQPPTIGVPRTVNAVGDCSNCTANALFDKYNEQRQQKQPQPHVDAESQDPHQASTSNSSLSRRGRSWVAFPTLKRSGIVWHSTWVSTPAGDDNGIESEPLTRVPAQPCGPHVSRAAHDGSHVATLTVLEERRLSV